MPGDQMTRGIPRTNTKVAGSSRRKIDERQRTARRGKLQPLPGHSPGGDPRRRRLAAGRLAPGEAEHYLTALGGVLITAGVLVITLSD